MIEDGHGFVGVHCEQDTPCPGATRHEIVNRRRSGWCRNVRAVDGTNIVHGATDDQADFDLLESAPSHELESSDVGAQALHLAMDIAMPGQCAQVQY